METTTTRFPIPTGPGELVRRTAVGVFVAVVAALAVRLLVGVLGVDLGVGGPATPFATIPILGSAVVAGAGAAVAYAALVRLTDRPVRNFSALAALVFVVMLIPVAVVTPTMGVTVAGQAVLVVLHAVVAVPLVAFVVGAVGT